MRRHESEERGNGIVRPPPEEKSGYGPVDESLERHLQQHTEDENATFGLYPRMFYERYKKNPSF